MKLIKFLDPILTIGTLLSIVISLILLALKVETIPTITFGLFGLTLSILIDLAARLGRQENKILSTLGLSETLFKDTNLHAYITDILNAWKDLSTPPTHSLLIREAEISIREFHSHIMEIASGEVVTDVSDIRPLTTVVDEAKVCINAISIISIDWWNSIVGKKYTNRNFEALRRGVEINRIFIINNLDSETVDFMKLMKKNGVHVMAMDKSDVPETLCKATVVTDNNFVWTSLLDQNNMPLHHHFSRKVEHVQQASERFAKLHVFAEELEDYLAKKHR